MSTGITPILWNAELSRSQKMVTIELAFALTAGTGVNSASLHRPVKSAPLLVEGGTGSALTTITQAAVNTLLGNTNDVVVGTAFGTTAMVDNDTYAFVLDMGGQATDVGGITVSVDIGGTAGSASGLGTKTALTNAAFTGANVCVSPAGNLYGRLNYTNISAAASAGSMIWRISVYLK